MRVILDWDDTIFASTWAEDYKNSDAENDPFRLHFNPFVAYHDRKVAKTISHFSKLGKVHIVTASMEGWVDTTLQYMPQTAYQIAKKGVTISHTKRTETCTYEDMVYQKSTIFGELLLDAAHDELVIGVGDQPHDEHALLLVRPRARTFTFPRGCGPMELGMYLSYIRYNYLHPKVVRNIAKDSDLQLEILDRCDQHPLNAQLDNSRGSPVREETMFEDVPVEEEVPLERKPTIREAYLLL
jgi:hypothetical protein